MRKVKKAQAKERMIFLMGALVICMLALVVVVRLLAGLESSREGQARVMANMIAISVNTLSTMDAGRVEKDFSLTKGSQPMRVEIYDKKGVMYVKVTYDEKGNFFEVPLLVKIDPVSPITANKISVIKGLDGKISLKGEITGGWEWIPTGEICTRQPSMEEIKSYVKEASEKYNVDANLIKAVITQESKACHCKDCKEGNPYTISSKGAVGLMQVMPSTAEGIDTGQADKNVFDARTNVMLGTKYLSDQIKAFGSVELGLVAYNTGPGWLLEKDKCSEGNKQNCHECIKICGLGAKSTLQDITNCECLPKQTRGYVNGVLSYRNSCYAQNTCALQGCKLC
ncbi:MAG: lytic transglycosylase domain-containing protein [Candidatus Aenigmatarchaeota archaeon]